MKALSVQQPWASLIVGSPRTPGIKRIENRSWIPPRDMIGRRFAIHASKKLDMEAFNELDHGMCGFRREQWPYARPNLFPVSAVIGVATLERFVRGAGEFEPDREEADIREPWCSIPADQRRWYFGPVGFVLTAIWRVPEPVPCKGALGFWTLSTDVEAQVVEQLARSA